MEGAGPASASGPPSCPFLHRRQSTKRDFSTMANRQRSDSPDSLFTPEDDHYTNEHTSRQPRMSRGLALPRRTPHFAGDGLDYRRPVMSSEGGANGTASRNTAAVIDLTEDDDSQPSNSHASSAPQASNAAGSSRAQRLPRFQRNIIDIDSDPEEEEPSEPEPARPNFAYHLPPPGHHRNPYDHHPRFSHLRRPARHNTNTSNMDDLEFVASRSRSRPHAHTNSRGHTPAITTQRSVTPYPTGLNDAIDLTGDDDDVVHLDTRTRQGVNLTSPGTTAGVGTRSVADRGGPFGGRFTNLLQNGGRLLERLAAFGGEADRRTPLGAVFMGEARNIAGGANGNHQHNDNQPQLRFGPDPPRMGAAIMMDYDLTAFDMGLMGGNRPLTPKYEPPEPPAEGFTRSPEEDEVVVCPNCGDELAVGDTEKKQEVWVIKKCGHVYCGDCAENRTKAGASRSKKGKGKAAVTAGPQTFKRCVIDGCEESASSKSMVRVYFGG